MSILFAAAKAIAGVAAATDISLTIANLATEGAVFFPEINDAKEYIEDAREQIPAKIDSLNDKRAILNTNRADFRSPHCRKGNLC